jgi:hypothetical protein
MELEEGDSDDEEEEEEGFDITDSSPEAAPKQQGAKQAQPAPGDNDINRRHKTISPSLKCKTDTATHHRSHFSTRTMRGHLRSKSTGSAVRFDVHIRSYPKPVCKASAGAPCFSGVIGNMWNR